MPRQHKVESGECISSIAYQYGFFPDTLWNDPANAALKALRQDPNVLSPGDIVNIPDPRPKQETRPTGALHRFQLKTAPAKLRLQILEDDQPLAFQPFRITIDGHVTRSGATTGEGYVIVSIPPNARSAVLVVGQGDGTREYRLRLGHLRPVEELEGVQTRLENLGYPCGEEYGTLGPGTVAALKAFQASQGLAVTGQPDDATRSKLEELHDRQG
jgi:hypothetical protein